MQALSRTWFVSDLHLDILQAVNERHILLPLEAYDLWQELGSQRAYAVLQSYRQK